MRGDQEANRIIAILLHQPLFPASGIPITAVEMEADSMSGLWLVVVAAVP
jgi:hypothetical protein